MSGLPGMGWTRLCQHLSGVGGAGLCYIGCSGFGVGDAKGPWLGRV